MKRLIFLLLLIPGGIIAQSAHQDQILSFVNKNIGKRVGSGACFDLVDKAFSQWDKRWQEKPSRYGREIQFAEVQPGDIIISKGGIESNGERVPSHIMIVYKKESNSTYLVANQNVGVQTLKESIVVITEYSEALWIKDRKNITVKYYRPL